jgi:hypothetical protein
MSAITVPPSFFARLWMALVCFFQIIFRPRFAQAVLPAYQARKAPAAEPAQVSAEPQAVPAAKGPARDEPEKTFASALFVLSALQREGRLIDFLQEEIAGAKDSEVGAAARVVHEGCRKVLSQYLALEPVLAESEGAQVTVPQGFNAERIRLTGNVTGRPPFSGALRHHGWVTRQVRFPSLSAGLDPRVLAPAEVELS